MRVERVGLLRRQAQSPRDQRIRAVARRDPEDRGRAEAPVDDG